MYQRAKEETISLLIFSVLFPRKCNGYIGETWKAEKSHHSQLYVFIDVPFVGTYSYAYTKPLMCDAIVLMRIQLLDRTWSMHGGEIPTYTKCAVISF